MARVANAALFRALSRQAEELGRRAGGNQLPVRLRPLAEKRRITSVEFQPLLVDAMLTTHPGGFRVFFSSDGRDPEELKRKYHSEESNGLLPTRLRFSFAHELAHTLFYDLAQPTPELAKRFRAGGGKNELENLETSCNRLAAKLLLPAALVRNELGKAKVLTAEFLTALAQKAGVSIEALIRRLNEQDQLLVAPFFPICILLLDGEDGCFRVKALATCPGFRLAERLLKIKQGQAWELNDADGHSIEAGCITSREVAFPADSSRRSKRLRYRYTQAPTGRGARSFIMTFEEILPT
ncbi:MAG TPA: ImmA/IrrE family metallo-endopeptidase [Candidatus Binatia bacterium]|jgi:hypothetical protein|nr:ImmA/IrrE family metallo-endopeptidase [Candidatus Binatia bacterium]